MDTGWPRAIVSPGMVIQKPHYTLLLARHD